jgi:hypothetical protein
MTVLCETVMEQLLRFTPAKNSIFTQKRQEENEKGINRQGIDGQDYHNIASVFLSIIIRI